MAEDLLIEIGCEELPTNAVKTLKEKFSRTLIEHLAAAKILPENYEVTTFAAPRRLGIYITKLSVQQAAQIIERQGPAYQTAFDPQGKPTAAAQGFAEACGVSVEQLSAKETAKGRFLYFSGERPGRPTLEILPELITQVFHKIPIDRPMRWGEHKTSFARPVHWLLVLFGKQLVPVHAFDLAADNKSYGHRFHHPGPIVITEPKDYVEKLGQAKVIPSFEERKNKIEKEIKSTLPSGYQIEWDQDLLNEITALVEWPVILMGKFNPEYLKIPSEVLITSMKLNQKYFPVFDAASRLQPQFIVASNIESVEPTAVVKGNERVLNARLSDAAFFFKNDCQKSLESRLPHLEHIIFQKQLGSIAHKTERIVALAEYIAAKIGANIIVAKQAAQLCKCDLLSEMVGEFPTLQGIMGFYYALNDGLDQACALAIKEHYYPRHSGDTLPDTKESVSVALADKLDTLVGIFGIHQAPTGEKDPFALRRAANGVLQILIEKNIALDLMDLLEHSKKTFPSHLPNNEAVTEIFDFMMQRLKTLSAEKGFSPQQYEAVLAKKPRDPVDFLKRLDAVQKFQRLPEAAALASANKRVRNILRKEAQEASQTAINPGLFEHDAEKQLAEKLATQNQKMAEFYRNGQYVEALEQLATLKPAVDLFFDKVMVMCDDIAKRHNRLALLKQLHELFIQIADISYLVA